MNGLYYFTELVWNTKRFWGQIQDFDKLPFQFLYMNPSTSTVYAKMLNVYSYHWQIRWCGFEPCWENPAQQAGKAFLNPTAVCTWSKWSWQLRFAVYSGWLLWRRGGLRWRAVLWLQVECPAWRVEGVSGSVTVGEGCGSGRCGAAGCGAWL